MKKADNQLGTGRRDAIKMIMAGSSAGILGLNGALRNDLEKDDTISGSSDVKKEIYSKLKITKIRYFSAPGYNRPHFNQARGIVEIETDGGITGIGEGGAKDTIEQCAQMMIGEDPFRIEHIWQTIYRGMFYPPGREKLHALGALEMALWDIKGKALGVPVYDLLGGATRDFVECYATGFRSSTAKTMEESAKACMDAGLRAYRIGPTGGEGGKDRKSVV